MKPWWIYWRELLYKYSRDLRIELCKSILFKSNMCDQKSSKNMNSIFRKFTKAQKHEFHILWKLTKLKKRRKTQRMDLILASFKNFRSDSHLGVVPSMLEVRRANIMNKSLRGLRPRILCRLCATWVLFRLETLETTKSKHLSQKLWRLFHFEIEWRSSVQRFLSSRL